MKALNKDSSEDMILKKLDMDISKLHTKRDEELAALLKKYESGQK